MRIQMRGGCGSMKRFPHNAGGEIDGFGRNKLAAGSFS
jgi:hypothetical protein